MTINPGNEQDLERLLVGAIRAAGGSITISTYDCELQPDEMIERFYVHDPSCIRFRIRDKTDEEKEREAELARGMLEAEERLKEQLQQQVGIPVAGVAHGPGHVTSAYPTIDTSTGNPKKVPSPLEAKIGEACTVCFTDPSRVHMHGGGR